MIIKIMVETVHESGLTDRVRQNLIDMKMDSDQGYLQLTTGEVEALVLLISDYEVTEGVHTPTIADVYHLSLVAKELVMENRGRKNESILTLLGIAVAKRVRRSHLRSLRRTRR